MTEIQQPPPGWYKHNGETRWWNGAEWTEHIAAEPPAQSSRQPVYTAREKSVGVAYALLILLGGFAAHHFYLQRWIAATVLLVLWWGGWLLILLGDLGRPSPFPFSIGMTLVFGVSIWCLSELFVLRRAVLTFNENARELAALEREQPNPPSS